MSRLLFPSSIFSATALLPTFLTFFALLAPLAPQVNAVALTTYIGAGEKSCFYADVDAIGEKIGFYFSVQSGGSSFDIAYTVQDPSERVILSSSSAGEPQSQGDFIFTANKVGEYTFCFENEGLLGVGGAKLLDFDIMVESEPRRVVLASSSQSPPISEQTSSLEESIFRLNGLFNKVIRMQKYFHTRHHRSHSTVLSTQSRIFWYSILECLAVVAMTAGQVWVLKVFFGRGGGRKTKL